MKIIIRQLGPATIRIYPASRYLETQFSDGTKVPAAPEDTDAYRATAREVGCGSTWELCWSHEILHSLLAASGGGVSPVLWAVAHGLPQPAWADQEEATILNLQRRVAAGDTGVDAARAYLAAIEAEMCSTELRSVV